MKLLLATLVYLAPAVAGRAPEATREYDRYQFFELVACADLVVSGRIVAVGDATYLVSVDENIVGACPERIRVKRFGDWTCAARWAKYAVGQEVVLFLEPTEQVGCFDSLGAGNEGDMPILEGWVVPGYRLNGFRRPSVTLDGVEVWGSPVPREQFVAAVRGFRTTFRWEEGERIDQVSLIEPRESMEATERYASSSTLARHLFEEAYSSEAWPRSVPHTEQVPGSLPRISGTEHGMADSVRVSRDRPIEEYDTPRRAGFGRSCAFLGDVDGDGIEDLGVGAPTDSFHGHREGTSWLLFLQDDGTPKSVVEIGERTPGFEQPMNDHDKLGATIGAPGDLDGDGRPDLLLGAPGWDGVSEGSGALWFMRLGPAGEVRLATNLVSSEQVIQAADPAWKPSDSVPEYLFLGASVARLGDLDGDGTCELAMGQTMWYGRLQEGPPNAVYILSVSTDGTVAWVSSLRPSETVDGGGFGFGEALCAVGDVDGDGVPDLAIGDSTIDDGGMLRGGVLIALLDRAGNAREWQLISDWEGGFSGLLMDGASFGKSLAGPGDVDLDGIPDLLVGSDEGLWLLYLNADGTVREHREIRDSRHGFTDVGTFGDSMACGSQWSAAGALPFVVGGTAGVGDAEVDVLWMLRLHRNGTVSAW